MPGSSDTVYIDATLTGTVTVDTTTNAAGSLNCTGATGTLAFTSGKTLAVSGSVTFDAGMTLTGSGTLAIAGTSTITLGSNLSANIWLYGSAFTMAGAYNITVSQLFSSWGGGSLTLVAGQTLNVTSSMTLESFFTIRSSVSSSYTYLNYSGTMANESVASSNFTDVDASGSAVPIYNYGTAVVLTRTKNIVNITALNRIGFFMN